MSLYDSYKLINTTLENEVIPLTTLLDLFIILNPFPNEISKDIHNFYKISCQLARL